MKKDIHLWFGLTYAQYLTIPRSVLQSMPEDWQHKFVELLEELGDTYWTDILPEGTDYRVESRKSVCDHSGKFKWGKKVDDPLQDYKKGRRDIFQEYGK
ncbi:hypothetical protein [Paenibacillus cremeus]|uniref:hypothetical protein n=1 Tax=Paenibacillus cremeus TaxID=2163881 RepID=UPI001646A208|nr:hypothetical protein [Paenibacillus cremeus]